MYYWIDISSSVTEAYEFFIRIDKRGMVLRHCDDTEYSTYIELDESHQHWSEEPFFSLNEAKAWCEGWLKQTGAPPAAFYVFAHQPEYDTETEICFARSGVPFNRYTDAVLWFKAARYIEADIRVSRMLDRVPEMYFEPHEASGQLRFQF